MGLDLGAVLHPLLFSGCCVPCDVPVTQQLHGQWRGTQPSPVGCSGCSASNLKACAHHPTCGLSVPWESAGGSQSQATGHRASGRARLHCGPGQPASLVVTEDLLTCVHFLAQSDHSPHFLVM